MKTSKRSSILVALILLGLVILGFILRWHKLTDHLFFGFEQGRDAERIMAIIQGEDLFLVGPKTDIAGVFHGPWYYYLMTIAYALGQGNPVAASLFLVLLSLSTIYFIYQLTLEVTEKKWAGLISAGLAAVSFELITYSRWLSNVSPAIPILAFSFWMLYKFKKSNKAKFFVLAAMSAGLAAQFEIILSLWLLFAWVMLFVLKIVSLPKPKVLLLGLAGAGFWYLPLLVFNIKYNWITLTSVKNYFLEDEAGISLITSAQTWLQRYKQLFERTLLLGWPKISLILALILLATVVWSWCNKKLRKKLGFLLVWFLMALPAIFFTGSVGLDQLYLGAGLSLLVLVGVLAAQLKTKTSKIIVGLMLVVVAGLNLSHVIGYLNQNQGMYFITIQEGLNYHDQSALIDYVITDAQNKPYRFKAFTIPYYQEQGWQYLHQYFKPNHSEQGANLIYLAIEAQVEDFWKQRWIEELGCTNLVQEKKFGKLMLQKREICQNPGTN